MIDLLMLGDRSWVDLRPVMCFHAEEGPTTLRAVPEKRTGESTLTCVGQAEGPEPQVRRGVGDAAQAELNGVDGLVDHGVTKVKLAWEETTENLIRRGGECSGVGPRSPNQGRDYTSHC